MDLISQIKTQLKHLRIKNNIVYPCNLEELKSLIQFANEKQIKIRVIGSAHSPENAIYEGSKDEIKIFLDGDLKKIEYIHPNSDDTANVRVGAGCHLGVDPIDCQSTWMNSFNYQVDQAGYALPTLGGISHQTIAGFLQTSSSGGSAQHNIADVIESIEWINGKGELCIAKKGEDLFNAVGVAMGLFGIITAVTFKLPKKYLVQGVEVNKEFTDSLLAPDTDGQYKRLQQALFGNEKHPGQQYIHINWLAEKYVNRTMEWTAEAVPVQANQTLKPYKHALQSLITTILGAFVLKAGNFIDRNMFRTDIALRFKAALLKLFANPKEKQEFLDVWYKALPIDDQARVHGLVKCSFSEIWFPENKLQEVMEKLTKLVNENQEAAGNFIIEIYSAKQSPFWLSPSYGSNALRIDLYWWDRNKGNRDEYFALFWDALLNIEGARLHPGKYMPEPGKKYRERIYQAEDIYRYYPKINDWFALREQMDPQQIFVTSYWRKMLNIKPLLELQKTQSVESCNTKVLQQVGLYKVENSQPVENLSEPLNKLSMRNE